MKLKVENLPDQCPPPEAKVTENQVLLRYVSTTPPTWNDFKSQQEEGRVCRDAKNLCRWHAVSFWTQEKKIHELLGLRNLPNLRGKMLASIMVDEKAGLQLAHEKDPQHISVWLSATFDPACAFHALVGS